MTVPQNRHLTFKGNVGAGRHDWLRLTPAYSYNLVKETLKNAERESTVLDPFSGTGTTGLVASEFALRAELLDVNAFLVWLVQVKCRGYSSRDIKIARQRADECIRVARTFSNENLFVPPMYKIERWWDAEILHDLARLKRSIDGLIGELPASDLILVAFCRAIIALSNVAFNHQSLSFRTKTDSQYRMFPQRAKSDEVFERFICEVETVLSSASATLPGQVAVHLDDARYMKSISTSSIDIIFTSPPYANRMSYIRELRPYMYWLGFLTDSKQAGDLDWNSIGGTWGSATSRLSTWDNTIELPIGKDFRTVIAGIASADSSNAVQMGNYVHKYFYDMYKHFKEAYRVLKPGGLVTYIVGNSTFYGNVVSTERWYADLLAASGFRNISINTVRKRNSNKKLYEYAVQAIRS